jgi:hypothetical protein
MVLSVLYRLNVQIDPIITFWRRRFSHLMDRAWLAFWRRRRFSHLMDEWIDRAWLASAYEWANSPWKIRWSLRTNSPCSSLILNGNLNRSSICVRDLLFSSKSFEYAYDSNIIIIVFCLFQAGFTDFFCGTCMNSYCMCSNHVHIFYSKK